MNGLEQRFQSVLGPIRFKAARAARRIPNRADADDFIAEVVAHGWQRFLACVAKGAQPERFPWEFARYAVLHVTRTLLRRDRRQIAESLPSFAEARRHYANAAEGVLDPYADNPADLAAVRVDYAAYRSRLSSLERRTLDLLSEGRGERETARLLGVGKGQLHRIKSAAEAEWDRYQNRA